MIEELTVHIYYYFQCRKDLVAYLLKDKYLKCMKNLIPLGTDINEVSKHKEISNTGTCIVQKTISNKIAAWRLVSD